MVANVLRNSGKVWIACPNCGFKSEKSRDWIAENTGFDCSICGEPVSVQGEMRTVRAPDDNSRIGRAFFQIGRSFGFGS